MICRKLIVLGDYSGKTCTIQTYIKDELCNPMVTIIDRYTTDVEANGQFVEVEIIDTTCGEKYRTVFREMYKGTDAFLIFFSVHSQTSYESVKRVWLPEIKKYCPTVPYVLVGTQGDISPRLLTERKVTFEQGQSLAREINAVEYVECWPDRKYNLEKVFSTAVAATL